LITAGRFVTSIVGEAAVEVFVDIDCCVLDGVNEFLEEYTELSITASFCTVFKIGYLERQLLVIFS